MTANEQMGQSSAARGAAEAAGKARLRCRNSKTRQLAGGAVGVQLLNQKLGCFSNDLHSTGVEHGPHVGFNKP